MGYTTDFTGKFKLNKPLDKETLTYLKKFSGTRRMKRKLDPKYGVEGEFYVDGGGDFGQAQEPNIIDYNESPSTQPGLWCQWAPTDDGKHIEWNGTEKFYEYFLWLKYILEKLLVPKGYLLSGVVHWTGEDHSDIGTIQAIGSDILVEEGSHKDSLLPVSVDAIKELAKVKKPKRVRKRT